MAQQTRKAVTPKKTVDGQDGDGQGAASLAPYAGSRGPGRRRPGGQRRYGRGLRRPGAGSGGPGGRCAGMSEVRHFFRTNATPVYFVGATPFNLLGLDRWVRNFPYVTYYDAWDGAHPRVVTPKDKPYVEFESGEEINNWLLKNAEIRAVMRPRARAVPGPRSPWCSSTPRPSRSATSSATT